MLLDGNIDKKKRNHLTPNLVMSGSPPSKDVESHNYH